MAAGANGMFGERAVSLERRDRLGMRWMAACAMMACGNAQGQIDNFWTEPSGGAWDNTNNWSLGVAPDTTHRAVFNEDFTYSVIFDTDARFIWGIDIRGEDRVTLDQLGGSLDLVGNDMALTPTLRIGTSVTIGQPALIVRDGILRMDSGEVAVGMDYKGKLQIDSGGEVELDVGAVLRIGSSRGEGVLEIGANGLLDSFSGSLWIDDMGSAQILSSTGAISADEVDLDGELSVSFGDAFVTTIMGDPDSMTTVTGDSASIVGNTGDFGSLVVQLGADVFFVDGSMASGLAQHAGTFVSFSGDLEVQSFELLSGAVASMGHVDVTGSMTVSDSDSRWIALSMAFDDGASLTITNSGEMRVSGWTSFSGASTAMANIVRVDNDTSGFGPGFRTGHLMLDTGAEVNVGASYVQSSGAELALMFDEMSPEYIRGGGGASTAQLAGLLSIDVTRDEMLEVGDVIPIMEFDTINGAFELFHADSLGDHRYLSVQYPTPALRGATDVVSIAVEALAASPSFAFSAFSSALGGGTPVAMTADDFDGDGFDDLAVVMNFGAGVNGQVRVLYNDGVDMMGDWKGFGGVDIVAVGKDPRDIAAVDMDGDFDVDLVVTNFGDDTAQVLYNTFVFRGGGTNFIPGAPVGVGDEPTNIETGEIDGMPGADVIIVREGEGATAVFPNDTGDIGSDGSTLNGESDPEDVDSGDIDNDKDTDVATSGKDDLLRGFGAGRVYVFENSNGSLMTADVYTVGLDPGPIVMGDLTGDGPVEIAVINRADETISVLINDGTGDYSVQAPIAVGGTPDCLLMLDAEADGDLDVFFIASDAMGDREVRFLRNDTPMTGSPTLTGPISLASSTPPVLITTGDADGDSMADLFTVQQSGGALLSRTGGRVDAVESADRLPDSAARGEAVMDQASALINRSIEFLPADLNYDGVVSAADLAELLGRWGPCPMGEVNCAGDLDGDGSVGASDLAALLGFWT